MSNLKRDIGERLFILKTHLGMTTEHFAEALGCKAYNLYNYKAGRAEPDASLYFVLFTKFGVNLNWLLGEGSEPMLRGEYATDSVEKTRSEVVSFDEYIARLSDLSEEVDSLKEFQKRHSVAFEGDETREILPSTLAKYRSGSGIMKAAATPLIEKKDT